VNPIDVLRYGQRDIDGLIDRLQPGDWTAIALGVWSTKDLVGHLGVFEVRFADVLAWFVGDAGVSGLMSADTATFNDDQAAIRHDWPVDRIVTEYRDAVVRVMTLAARVPSERWTEVGTIPWYGPAYAMDDLLVYSMYGHKREHQPQLEAILDRPGG
jgi:Mycothiol maleylpyruvate isomerase N-terminal domain